MEDLIKNSEEYLKEKKRLNKFKIAGIIFLSIYAICVVVILSIYFTSADGFEYTKKMLDANNGFAVGKRYVGMFFASFILLVLGFTYYYEVYIKQLHFAYLKIKRKYYENMSSSNCNCPYCGFQYDSSKFKECPNCGGKKKTGKIDFNKK